MNVYVPIAVSKTFPMLEGKSFAKMAEIRKIFPKAKRGVGLTVGEWKILNWNECPVKIDWTL